MKLKIVAYHIKICPKLHNRKITLAKVGKPKGVGSHTLCQRIYYKKHSCIRSLFIRVCRRVSQIFEHGQIVLRQSFRLNIQLKTIRWHCISHMLYVMSEETHVNGGLPFGMAGVM